MGLGYGVGSSLSFLLLDVHYLVFESVTHSQRGFLAESQLQNDNTLLDFEQSF